MEKSKKQTFEISISFKKIYKFFFSKNACLRQRRKFFFLDTTKRCANESSLSWSMSDFKNKFMKYEKKWKTNVWSLDLDQKMNFFSRYACSRHMGQFFYDYYRTVRKWKFFKLVRIRFEKQVSEVQKKVQNKRLKTWFGKKMANFFLQKMLAYSRGDNFF